MVLRRSERRNAAGFRRCLQRTCCLHAGTQYRLGQDPCRPLRTRSHSSFRCQTWRQPIRSAAYQRCLVKRRTKCAVRTYVWLKVWAGFEYGTAVTSILIHIKSAADWSEAVRVCGNERGEVVVRTWCGGGGGFKIRLEEVVLVVLAWLQTCLPALELVVLRVFSNAKVLLLAVGCIAGHTTLPGSGHTEQQRD